MDQDDPNAAKIDAIVGAALRAMAQGESDDRALGAFAANFRRQVGMVLRAEPTPTEPPDLLALIRQTVQEAMYAGEPTARGPRRRRLTVLVGGQKTSVTVPASLADSLVKLRGTPAAARDALNAMAAECPPGEIRSRWVEQQIRAMVALDAQGDGLGVPKH